MQIETIRFGPVEVDEEKLISFAEGIPGLEDFKKYALLKFDESYPILWLQSIESDSVCLPVLDIFAVIPDYVFDIADDDAADLELKRPEDLHVLTVLVIPDDARKMTSNLAAPITINVTVGKAKQLILSGSDYNVRTPIFQNIRDMILREEGGRDASAV